MGKTMNTMADDHRRAPEREQRRKRLFLWAIAAMVVLCLSVPTYTSAKAGYALALVPVIGLLSAYGAEPLLKHAVSRCAPTVQPFCWVGTVVYCTYWAG